MSLKLFDTKDAIPEAQRDAAIETKDGKWAVADVEDVSGLKSALERQKDEARKAKDRAKELEDKLKAKESGLSDEELAKRRAEIDEKVAPVQEKLDAAETELRKLRLDSRIKSMLGEAGANPKRLDALLTLTLDRFDLNESGSPIVKDKPTEDLKKYIGEKIAAEYPELFLSKQKGSTRADGSNGTGGGEDLAKLVTENPRALLDMANAE